MAVVNIWLEMARSQFQEGDLDAALGSIDRALQMESTADAWALKERILTEKTTRGERAIVQPMAADVETEDWLEIARSKFLGGNLEQALISVERSLKMEGGGNAFELKGQILQGMGRYAEAVEANQAAMTGLQGVNRSVVPKADVLKQNQNKTILVNQLLTRGNERWTTGDFLGAIEFYDQAIALNPNECISWDNKGLALNALGRYEEALVALERAISLNTYHVNAWSNRVTALAALGRNEETLICCEKLIVLRPNDYAGWRHRGDALQMLLRHEEAIDCYEKSITINRTYSEAWNGRGSVFKELEKYESALSDYDQAISFKPNCPYAWSNRGGVLLDLKRPEDALSSCNKSIQLKSDHYHAWYCRGKALSQLKRYEEAIKSYDQAIEANPNFYYSWFELGETLFKMENYEKSVLSYNRAIELNPNYVYTHTGIAQSLRYLTQYEESLKSSDRAIFINPDYYLGWSNRGSALAKLERYVEALDSYNKAVQLNPDDEVSWSNRSSILIQLNKNEEALISCEKSIEINRYYEFAWENHGCALCKLKRYEESIESYNRAIEIKPNYYGAFTGRGDAFKELERYEEAISSYDKAIEIKPDYYEALNSRGEAFIELERYEEAVEAYSRVIKLKPDDHSAWYYQGNAFKELKRYHDAIESYDRAIALKPDYDYAWYYRGTALYRLDLDERAIASYEKLLEYRIDDHFAWHSRGMAAQYSRTFARIDFSAVLNQTPANLHKIHPDLSERGYSGYIASLTVGLIHCPAATHPLGHGYLQRELGDAHWKYAYNYKPKSQWIKALTCYNASEKALTIADNPEERLQTLQRLVRVHFALNTPTETLTALIRQGRELRDRILTQAKSQPQRDRLHRTLPNFNEFTVDFLLRQGDIIRAIETAEADKNGLMQWLLPSTETPNYHQMRQWIAHRTVVYWHFSANALTTFILTAERDRPIVLSQPNPETALKQRNELETWIENWNKSYNTHLETSKKETNNTEKTRSEWQSNLETELEKLATILDIPTLTTHLHPAKPLILIPHRDLHRLPLPSFFPDFLVTTLPSIQLGRNLRSPQPLTPTVGVASRNGNRLLNIPAPSHQDTSPLPHSALESTVLAQLYQSQSIPVHTIDRCTLPQLQTALPNHHTHLHFNGHAYYNDQNPKQSALALQDTDRLTVEDLRSIDLQHYQLITLASCETALTGNQTLTAEYVGLVSAFLSHRIPHILSTLWTVQSHASALLILQFYRQLLKGNPPAQALRHSQHWLQTLTHRKLDRLYRTVLHHITNKNAPTSAESRIEAFLDQECSDLGTMEPNQKPYQDPYFWAAFILAGRH